MNTKSGLIAKVSSLITQCKEYWRVPPPGRYMTFKEILSYSGGGIGVYCLVTVVTAMTLSTTNTLIGNTIGIDPTTMYILYIISTIAGIPLTAIRAHIIDNSLNKKGKYRPFLVSMGIPATILAIGFVWMPYEHMNSFWKSFTVLAFNIGFQFFYNFFYDAYDNLIHVLSPNSQERTDTLSIKSIVYSLAPSIITPLMPLLAGWLTGGNLMDIRLYRYVYPPIAFIGMMVSLIAYANTREKIVQARTHVIQIKFIDALKAVAKNKYFWIISLAGWIGFLESAYNTILVWLYQYQGACTAPQYSLITLIYGNASFWGMLLCPFAIRRYGKKAVLITTNLLNILFIALLYPSLGNIWIVLVFMFGNAVAGSFAQVLSRAINGDIRDYQQYITGERIDGMFSAVGLIGSFITMLTSGVLPVVYRTIGGIYDGNGYENPYDILYDPDIFTKLLHFLIILAVFGAIMNVIPYFFYDLTDNKQRGIVSVLRVRALFEDYGNNALSDERLVEAIDLIENSRRLVQEGTVTVSKDAIRAARKSHDKAAVKAAKKAYKAAIQHNKEVEVAQAVVQELDKFSDPRMQDKLTVAKQLISEGLDGLSKVEPEILKKARALPRNTPEEKAIRKEEIEMAKKRLTSRNVIRKHYPNGIELFDDTEIYQMFDRDDELNQYVDDVYKRYIKAREAKNADQAAQLKAEIQSIKAERNELKKKIKAATNERAIYNRAVKPYIDARNLILQSENYQHYDEIAAQYDDAKKRADEARQKLIEEENQRQAEKKQKKAAGKR